MKKIDFEIFKQVSLIWSFNFSLLSKKNPSDLIEDSLDPVSFHLEKY